MRFGDVMYNAKCIFAMNNNTYHIRLLSSS